MKITIYHNPSCSKSRAVLSILNKKQVEFDLIDYLKTPPTKVALQKILFKIGGNASDLLRTNEKEYKILGLENATDEQISEWNVEIANMTAHTAYHTGQIMYIRKRNGWWK